MERKVIYWIVNNEVRKIEEEEYRKYREYVESDEEKKCVYAGYVKYDLGSFDVDICVKIEDKKLVIYIEKEWTPAPGYSWSETEIKKISLDIS